MKKDKNINIRVDPDTYDKWYFFALSNNLYVSELIRRAVDWLILEKGEWSDDRENQER